MNSPERLEVSPAAASTPTGVFNQRFDALFPCTGALCCEVCFAPCHSYWFIWCANAGTQGLPVAALLRVVSAPAACATPPTFLDECFFFISLVVGLSYSSIFCQFWLFFVFKLLLSFFWFYEEAQCVYLYLHLDRKSGTLFFP